MKDAERIRRSIAALNEKPGLLNSDHTDEDGNLVRADGIECPICKNRGFFYVLQSDDRGHEWSAFRTCECSAKRSAVRRLREAGLERTARRCSFEAFEAQEPYQRKMLETARDYLSRGARCGRWLYIGGQSGCGKTHICTATAVTMIESCGYALRYMIWPHEARRIKAAVNDAEAYAAYLHPFQNAQALYIDDFLKPVMGGDGRESSATAADLRLAFDILNLRYVDSRPTIISSEWFLSELGSLDEAVAGRIAEMCGPWKLDIARDPGRNRRLRAECV